MSKTQRNATRGWRKEKPGFHQKTIMLKRCGRKCFLGPGKSFPICKKKTCKISRKGVQSAYIRAKQYRHKKISQKAKRILNSI
jgi:hypothetical protein